MRGLRRKPAKCEQRVPNWGSENFVNHLKDRSDRDEGRARRGLYCEPTGLCCEARCGSERCCSRPPVGRRVEMGLGLEHSIGGGSA